MHTKGPWTIERDEVNLSHYGEPTFIIKAPGPIGRMYYREDAELTIAAPEMLQALRDIEGTEGFWRKNGIRSATTKDLRSIARAAIARAEGKE